MDLAAKLQIKPGHAVVLIDAPDGFVLQSDSAATGAATGADAVVGFVVQRSDLSRLGAVLAAAREDRLERTGWRGPAGLDRLSQGREARH